ncbi:sulfatase-like hydrolase/transferase [Stieleria sp. ICT_E10.1]|uniref:sulfatase-like hydrolase/transferase n=1 Tax=Stieleria sedimenti TaxID=2976331 RepID=UPI00217FB49A|nr:sulfatase-like hydrolase/transferase [Stieleria sedimenti]MCS7465709.1 sulfatase-like hydrolase/transferase [Stieleria sedimenti]
MSSIRFHSLNHFSTRSPWAILFACLLTIAGVGDVAGAAERPNILWITSEDNGISWVSCYGGTNAQTPAIDQLAKEGFRYTHCFDNAAVCAPTRSCWITGMYAISNGTQPMRSRNEIPHDKIKYYPDLLRQAGYHTSNPGKTDYNIGGRGDKECWDFKGAKGKSQYGWKHRNPGQPFFAVVNIGDSHESRAHGDVENTKNDPAKMKLFSYHPDLPVIRKNYAKYADAVENMDRKVQDTIDALKNDGLYEDTIVIYNSDHGGVMARSKRFLYSSGVHCPLVVRIPEKWKQLYPAEKPGMTVDRIVSFVDMPKTWLSLAGAEIPEQFQGTIFLGDGTESAPRYHLGFRERADERLDNVRLMRDERFAYHKNYMPYASAGQHLAYLWKAPLTPAWEQHHREGKTDAITGRFFRPRVSEEFYDTEADFDNVHNLIDAPEHQRKIAELKQALREKQLELRDSGLMPEKMRERRAAANDMTLYAMVRDESLYPLEKYLDAADVALARDKDQLQTFVKQMADSDEAMRWWAVVGIHLLGDDARPAAAELKQALQDDAHEVRMMAAWTLINLGHTDKGLACLDALLFKGTNNETMLENVIDWIGEPALPLIKKYIDQGRTRQGKYGIGIFGRIAELNGW